MIRVWLKREWLLLAFAALTLGLALIDPQPLTHYCRWLQPSTLAGLLGLLIAIQGIRDSGFVQAAAGRLMARMHSMRSVALLLVLTTTVLSMVLTNDVSLFLLVPMTVAIGAMSNLPVLRMVVLEALAVNAGSTLSPIGNPQNLLLWQSSQLSFGHFLLAMVPAAAVMLALLVTLTWLWMPRERIDVHADQLDGRPVSLSLALLSVLLLISMVVLIERGHALLGAGMMLVPFALFSWRSLLQLDWLLLLTFAAIFLGLGHLAELPLVSGWLDRLNLQQPLTLYASGILISQLISNVPATVLLLNRVSDPLALAVAVNVGGFGLVIGSLANLIALRLAKQPHSWRLFHLISIPFLLICAPLVYFAMRFFG